MYKSFTMFKILSNNPNAFMPSRIFESVCQIPFLLVIRINVFDKVVCAILLYNIMYKVK
jgi:hypothetical protein